MKALLQRFLLLRFIPYQDMYNIYVDYYGKEIVTVADIIECSSLLFLGRFDGFFMLICFCINKPKKKIFIDWVNNLQFHCYIQTIQERVHL